MSFLQFAFRKLLWTIVGALAVIAIIIVGKYTGERCPWIGWTLVGLFVLYIFVRCWYEDYEKKYPNRK